MDYLILDSVKEAEDCSRQAWLDVLGRDKRPQDITEFLWGRRVGVDGRTALPIVQREDLVPLSRQGGLVAMLDDINWPVEISLVKNNGLG